MENIIKHLYEIDAVKFGLRTLKSGILSPIYFDLRVIVSYPDILNEVSDLIWTCMKDAGLSYASVCGVPYTALPMATVISSQHKVPMLIRRKEAKDYGTKKMVEGHFKAGDVCLVIEDVVTSGSSVLETVETLKQEGLTVTDAVVLLDREQGGAARLKAQGITLHSIIKLSTLLDVLHKAGSIDTHMCNQVRKFIADNKFAVNDKPTSGPSPVLSYKERSDMCTHPLSGQLFSIMAAKQTNLAVSADVASSQELLKLAEETGPHICVLKTHVDILEDFSPELPSKLLALAEKHNFLLFEDRKFADIGNTVAHQYTGGLYRIADWAHITNAHLIPGPGIVKALKQAGQGKSRGCLLIAQMSSEGNLCKEDYTKECVKVAEEYPDFVMGFICQQHLSDNPNFVHMTPGVKLEGSGDGLGQQYTTPSHVIGQKRSDIIIVGRGITQATNPAEAAKLYKQAGYEAHASLLATQ